MTVAYATRHAPPNGGSGARQRRAAAARGSGACSGARRAAARARTGGLLSRERRPLPQQAEQDAHAAGRHDGALVGVVDAKIPQATDRPSPRLLPRVVGRHAILRAPPGAIVAAAAATAAAATAAVIAAAVAVRQRYERWDASRSGNLDLARSQGGEVAKADGGEHLRVHRHAVRLHQPHQRLDRARLGDGCAALALHREIGQRAHRKLDLPRVGARADQGDERGDLRSRRTPEAVDGRPSLNGLALSVRAAPERARGAGGAPSPRACGALRRRRR